MQFSSILLGDKNLNTYKLTHTKPFPNRLITTWIFTSNIDTCLNIQNISTAISAHRLHVHHLHSQRLASIYSNIKTNCFSYHTLQLQTLQWESARPPAIQHWTTIQTELTGNIKLEEVISETETKMPMKVAENKGHISWWLPPTPILQT